MNYNFTERVRKVLSMARQQATRLQHDYVGTEHILLGLVGDSESVAANVLESLDVEIGRIHERVEGAVRKGKATIALGELPYTSPAKKVLEFAVAEARELNHSYVGTEHLLLGLLRESKGIAAQVLNGLGVTIEDARAATLNILGSEIGAATSGVAEGGAGAGGPRASTGGRKSKTPALDHFCRDLTDLARRGELDPIIGREEEIERVVEILCRRKKNNPVLIGEPGVGKTAVVEGLSQLVARGEVTDVLRDHRVLALDMAAVVAGTKYRGQFEERLKVVTSEIAKNRNVVLFIDELHTLVGAGAAEGAIDASNMLKPALARGELRCIGASTLNEYRKYVEKDGALERRFQPVIVEPPSVEDTVEILRGLKRQYEDHHEVEIPEETLAQASQLADRYITDRFLPDKAIDVIDEAGARVRIASRTAPPQVDELTAALAALATRKEDAIRGQDFEGAAQLRDEERELQQRIRDEKTAWEEERQRVRPKMTVEDVSFVVSRWTGVPLTRLREAETERLVNMEAELHKRIVGQDHAIAAVSKAIRRGRAGLKDPDRPIGSFIFSGPTGVGKTELARTLAEFLFADGEALVRVDMSEYMEKFSVSRLIGAPPGYVGYQDSGALTKAIRRRPYSVVLFDEIEKAHPDVFNILLQVLDEGRLTDNYGRVVDFRNTVLIMTSNLGARDISKGGLGFRASEPGSDYEFMRDKVAQEIERAFNPEFLNRVDDTIVFHPLGRAEIGRIVHVLLDDVIARLGRDGMSLALTDAAVDFLVERGYDEKFGARPLKRAIRQHLEDPLSEKILLAEFRKGDEIEVDAVPEADALSFGAAAPAPG